jgi:hypothetical protein
MKRRVKIMDKVVMKLVKDEEITEEKYEGEV